MYLTYWVRIKAGRPFSDKTCMESTPQPDLTDVFPHNATGTRESVCFKGPVVTPSQFPAVLMSMHNFLKETLLLGYKSKINLCCYILQVQVAGCTQCSFFRLEACLLLRTLLVSTIKKLVFHFSFLSLTVEIGNCFSTIFPMYLPLLGGLRGTSSLKCLNVLLKVYKSIRYVIKII